MLVYGLWFQLHAYLMQHKFSIEEVHNFIVNREAMNERPYTQWSMQYSPSIDTVKASLSPDDLRPEILQFSRNTAPPEQKIFESLFERDKEKSLALGMVLHSRLGSDAPHLSEVLKSRELFDLITKYSVFADQEAVGFKGPATIH
jgi:hypothetical protein